MKTLTGVVLIAAAIVAMTVETAAAGYCGATRHKCRKTQCCETQCCCSAQECYTVMKTCREVVYEAVEKVCFDTVYEEIKETVKVPFTKYVEQTRYRMMKMECSRPQESCCEASGCCDSCGEAETCFVCEPCIRKMPYKILVPVAAEKTEEVTRVVERKIPKNVTCYIPHVVCKQVPVEVCVPVPCCCKKSCCRKDSCCSGQTCSGDE